MPCCWKTRLKYELSRRHLQMPANSIVMIPGTQPSTESDLDVNKPLIITTRAFIVCLPCLSHNGKTDLITSEQPRSSLPAHRPELDVMGMVLGDQFLDDDDGATADIGTGFLVGDDDLVVLLVVLVVRLGRHVGASAARGKIRGKRGPSSRRAEVKQ